MAERRRSWLPRWGKRNRPEQTDLDRLGELLNTQNKAPFEWDGKTLASLSRLQVGTSTSSTPGFSGPKTVSTEVDYTLLTEIAQKCEVVNAILRRTSDDVLANGYHFTLKEGLEKGDQAQLDKVRAFMAQPNADNMCDELLEGLIHDLTLFGDCYIELSGSEDTQVGSGWDYGGDLLGIWRISADTMYLLPGSQTPKPPKMAYQQKYKGETKEFTSAKVLHITKHKQGRAYGQSPIISLMGVIAGYLNLQNYIGDLFTGTIPKTILNVGDISNAEMKAMLGLIEQQLVGGQSPYGLVTINGGTGFALHKLIDSAKEGQFLDLLYYYREEICAVFGIPPMKLGFVQTGKLANPEQQLDVWYDVVDLYQRRIAQTLNMKILPLLGITDWDFKFVSIRPKREGERAQVLKEQAGAISNLRQESIISINEARAMLNLEALEEDDARDPFFLSPKLSINKGASNAGGDGGAPADGDDAEDEEGAEGPKEESVNLNDLFPPPPKTDYTLGIEKPEPPGPIDEVELSEEQRSLLISIAQKGSMTDDLLEVEDSGVKKLDDALTESQSIFANTLLRKLNGVFANDKAKLLTYENSTGVLKDSDFAGMRVKDLQEAIGVVDGEIAATIPEMADKMGLELRATYIETLDATAAGVGITLPFTQADDAALVYWNNIWRLPALENTLGAYRGLIMSVFDKMVEDNLSWQDVSREMRNLIDPAGTTYPKYFYERIARTETRRVVENGHLSGLAKAGFEKVQRLVTVDQVTDPDRCLPYEDSVYSLMDSYGVLPAHPNCRCTFISYIGDEKPVSGDDVLIPDPLGSE